MERFPSARRFFSSLRKSTPYQRVGRIHYEGGIVMNSLMPIILALFIAASLPLMTAKHADASRYRSSHDNCEYKMKPGSKNSYRSCTSRTHQHVSAGQRYHKRGHTTSPETFHQSYMNHLERQAHQAAISRMSPPKPFYFNHRNKGPNW
jgi:hypothetical protein